jgi:peptidoglycan/LPS O-acetylase OafA/YrhL
MLTYSLCLWHGLGICRSTNLGILLGKPIQAALMTILMVATVLLRYLLLERPCLSFYMKGELN